ncbi:MAG: sulfotransferase domain-containing protein [Pseudomonadota bacterium]
MARKRGIVWLASYPKSGNTWARMFLANYLVNGDKPFPINQAHRFAMTDSGRETYEMVAKRPVNGSNFDEILRLRNRVLNGIVANGADVNFVKTHNTAGLVQGQDMVPKEITRAAIYIVRNPLDVALSYARHFNRSHEHAAMALARADNWLPGENRLVAQVLGRWDQHVMSWARPSGYPTLVIRYEDVLADPEAEFTKVLNHIGIPIEPERLKKAVNFSSFKALADQEKGSGFVEKPDHAQAFFSKGQSGQWKTELAPTLKKKIRSDHRKVMKKFGYLDE